MLRLTTLLLTLWFPWSCADDDVDEGVQPAFTITEPGTGVAATGPLLPLRPGYFVVRPEGALFGAITRKTRLPSGPGHVLSMPPTPGATALDQRFDYVLDDTKAGLVVRRAGGDVLDPPWLIVPKNPRNGMKWNILDGSGHVLASARIEVNTVEHPSAGPTTVHTITVDVPRNPLNQPPIVFPSSESWRNAVARQGRGHADFDPGLHKLSWNPLRPAGDVLVWHLVEGRGFYTEASAFIPDEARSTGRIEEAIPLTAAPDLGFQGASSEVAPNGSEALVGAWSVSVVRAENHHVSIRVDGRAPEDDFAEIAPVTARLCRATGTTYSSDAAALDCPDAPFYETFADGAATPTIQSRLGYALATRVSPVFDPANPEAGLRRPELRGAFVGVFRDASGRARGLARNTPEGPISHEAPIARAEPAVPGLDPDYPAEGNVYFRLLNGFETTSTRVGSPPLTNLRRVVAAAAETPTGGVALLFDQYPFVGHGTLRRELPEGAPATSYVPDFELDGLLPDPLTIVYEGDGRRSAFVAEYEGAIFELDWSGDTLRRRSLGRPAVPDGHFVIGAYREGREVVVLTRSGTLAITPYPRYVSLSADHRWTMPVREGAWEPWPSHTFPGVQAVTRDEAGTALTDALVCVPPGQTLDVTTLAFDGVPTEAVRTHERCAYALRNDASTDLAALTSRGTAAASRLPHTLRFRRTDLGPVTVWGLGQLSELGGRYRVPEARWTHLRREGLRGPDGRHTESYATPIEGVLAGEPLLVDDRSGTGTWVVETTDRAACDELIMPASNAPCVDVTFVPYAGGLTRVRAPASRTGSSSEYALASDRGLFLVPTTWVGTDGSVERITAPPGLGIDAAIAEFTEGTSSPAGPRPPLFQVPERAGGLDDSPIFAYGRIDTQGRVYFARDGGCGPTAPATGLKTDTVVPDPWRGVCRAITLPDDALAFFRSVGGDIDPGELLVNRGAGTMLFVRRRVGAPEPWALYVASDLGAPTELLAAGVATGVSEGNLDLLPHPLLLEPKCRCKSETERCTTAGACACAPEHTRVGSECVPVLGGSFAPAPSCDSIEAVTGARPARAFIDTDGTAWASRPANASGTVEVECRADGLMQVLPLEEGSSVPVDRTSLYGAFDIDLGALPFAFALYDAVAPTLLPYSGPRSNGPILAAFVDSTGPLPKLYFRARSREVDLGLPQPGAYRLTRDAAGVVSLLRDGVTLASDSMDASPLYGRVLSSAEPVRVAYAGTRCLPAGRDYGAGLCTCAPASCETRAHECGVGDDGCFGTVDCGACEGGSSCAFNRCSCEPDSLEPNDSGGYYQAAKLGVDEAAFIWSHDFPTLTLDRPGDVDQIEIQGGDRAFGIANEFVVTLRGEPGVTYRLEAGFPTGCATSCATGTAITMEPFIPPTRPPGCVVEGGGTLVASFRVQCDLGTVDADRGPYLVRVTASDPDRAACVAYELRAEIRAASTFP